MASTSTAVYTLHFDGSCGPKNPGGTAAYGFTLHRFGDLIKRGNAVLGTGPQFSNNVAEYAGLYEGLAAFAEHIEWLNQCDGCRRGLPVESAVHRGPGYDSIVCTAFKYRSVILNVRGDSMLVVNQMSGKWKAKGGLYLNNFRLAEALMKDLRRRGVRIAFEWIPRESNQECDDLSKLHQSGRAKLSNLAAGPEV